MLNMQNVKDIEITEGDVRTIHDKDNKLIWGRLAYDTKYAGNTIQDGTPTPDAPVNIQVVTGTQVTTVTGKNICSECKTENANKLLYFRLPHLSYGEIVLSATLNVSLTGNTYGLELDGVFTQLGTWSTQPGNRLNKVFSLTDAQVQSINNSTEAWIRTYKSAGGFEIPSDAMIEYGTDASAYEPYQSQSYTINLGSTELCKIGDYQDYIYKNGDDWYLHKETNKAVYDGTETWYQWSYSSAFITVLDAINPSTRTTGIVMSNRFIEGASTTQGSQWNDFPNGTVAIRQFTDQPKIGFKTDEANDLATWKTWLTTHNTTVYYALATPTDTQITDSTLISQLDAIHQFLTRYGYNSSVTGNLPLIINQTSL